MKCKVENCDIEVTSRTGLGVCEKHYMRMRRHGHFDRTNHATTRMHSQGYVLVPADSHPLAIGSHVAEHRKVFYDTSGCGPFTCYHCGAGVTWKIMHVDHLDDDKTNNTVGNLVASCARCNLARGIEKMKSVKRSQGTIIEFDGVSRCLSEWASMMRIAPSAMANRLAKWPLKEALTKPKGKTGPLPKRYTEQSRP